MDIIEPNKNFDFSKLSLSYPNSIQNNTYFTRILYKDKPLYIQTPKIITKQGFVKNNKKIYCDLLFDNTNEDFIYWIENLENKCQSLIYSKSNEWFEKTLELNEIESAFNSCLKLFKSGKYYLLRSNVKINSLNGNPFIKIYDEKEKTLTMDDVHTETNIISIIEVEGIKFTNKNFQIDLELKQMMVLNTDIIFENCLIKKRNDVPSDNLNTYTNVVYLQENTIVDDNTRLNEDVNEKNKKDVEEENTTKNLETLSENIIENIEKTESIGKYNESYEINNLENTDFKDEQPDKAINEQNDFKEEQPDKEINEQNDLKEQQLDKAIIEQNDLKEEQLDKAIGESLTEFDLSFSLENNLETEPIKLKNLNEVYYKMYKEARQKAKEAKKNALIAYLEAKNIKQTFMLEDIDESSDDSDNEMQIMDV